MIHRLEIDNNCVVVCGDSFLEAFYKALTEELNKEFNKNKYDK
jgi:hypothetical protein